MRFPARFTLLGVSVATVCGTTGVLPVRGAQWGHTARVRGPVIPGDPDPPLIHGTGYAGGYREGVAIGHAFDAYYGVVQVQAIIRAGRVVAIRVLQHPSHSATSRFINERALPRLEQEVISAQSAKVNAVSGATLTSEAFIRSVGDALRQAGG